MKHDWQRLDAEYFECVRCHVWSRVWTDAECVVKTPAASAPEPVPAEDIFRIMREEQIRKDATVSESEAVKAARAKESRLRNQRLQAAANRAKKAREEAARRHEAWLQRMMRPRKPNRRKIWRAE
jgi:hypothetical protein